MEDARGYGSAKCFGSFSNIPHSEPASSPGCRSKPTECPSQQHSDRRSRGRVVESCCKDFTIVDQSCGNYPHFLGGQGIGDNLARVVANHNSCSFEPQTSPSMRPPFANMLKVFNMSAKPSCLQSDDRPLSMTTGPKHGSMSWLSCCKAGTRVFLIRTTERKLT